MFSEIFEKKPYSAKGMVLASESVALSGREEPQQSIRDLPS